MSLLKYDRIDVLPIVHGRLAFALEARRRMLEENYKTIAIELPASLKDGFTQAVELLPIASILSYREQASFLQDEAPVYYVPIQPADGIVEAVRIAMRERVRVEFIDAEIGAYEAAGVSLPDPHSLHTLGIRAYFDCCQEVLSRHPRIEQDKTREAHMAARLEELLQQLKDQPAESQHAQASEGRILYICGMAHWNYVRQHLEAGTGQLYEADFDAQDIAIAGLEPASIPYISGEIPFLVECYEEYRAGFELDDFNVVEALKALLLEARSLHEIYYHDSFEVVSAQQLGSLLNYLRKMTVRSGMLIPDSYHLVVAAKGVIGNDFAYCVIRVAHRYQYNGHYNPNFLDSSFPPPQPPGPQKPGNQGDASANPYENEKKSWGQAEGEWQADAGQSEFGESRGWTEGQGAEGGEDSTNQNENEIVLPAAAVRGDRGIVGGNEVDLICRTPGSNFEYGRLKLELRPDSRHRMEFENNWDPQQQCSWPPEDLIIENFRDYVGKRALSLAKISQSRSEPFTSSFLDGIDLRETLRDVVERRIFVREEPKESGKVGALVIIFEEDDFGMRFTWRSTWMAEHKNESTLAFYATDYRSDMLGPGVARAHYGGCMMIFPPIAINDVWNDLRFERAKTPSERLLLAAIFYSEDHYVVHVGARVPSEAIRAEAANRKKHIIHLPLSTFSPPTMERLRRLHVLNGQEVRSWAAKFIR